MSDIVDPIVEPTPESVDVRVMRDGEWIHVGSAIENSEGQMVISFDDSEEGDKIARHITSGYINGYSIQGG